MQYRKILVPLDGSALAESALPYAEKIAGGCGTEEVILVSVTERMTARTDLPELKELYRSSDRGDVGGTWMGVTLTFGKLEEQARRYLAKVADRLAAGGARVRAEVLMGKPADEIAGYAERAGADIIVMSSHGRSGVSRWAYGSVADKVLRSTCVPVMMVRAPGCGLDFKEK